jgi:polyvinyl alcohol dehydrogenase (cytochrome)
MKNLLMLLVSFFVSASFDATLHAEEVSGATIFEENCAACHNGNVPKAPHQIVFRMSAPESILETLKNGVMQAQAGHLSLAEKTAVAEYLSGQKIGQSEAVATKMCSAPLNLAAGADQVTSWGMGLKNERYRAATQTKLTRANIGDLKLRWAFAYPGASRARSQPTVYGDVIFVGSQDGTVYALDMASGCAYWTFKAEAEIRSAISIDATADGVRLYFGDFKGHVYGVEGQNGKLIWSSTLDDHADVTITGSPRLHDGRLYVPMSSSEWATAADPNYSCCTFRGGVAAFETATGKMLWKSHVIQEEPAPTGEENPLGVPFLAPAGAPVWNSPTIDEKRGVLYVGTGEAYSSPAAKTSDSVVAFRLRDGAFMWAKQLLPGDAWNMSCFIGSTFNCPSENGPDLDVGAPPVLVQSAEKGDMIVVGQKSGAVYGLDPDDQGRIVWKQKLGRGGLAGGVHWGMAAHGEVVYAPMADTSFGEEHAEEAFPGVFAVNAFSGERLWYTRAEGDCPEGSKPACDPGVSAAISVTDEIIVAGAYDGLLRIYDRDSGAEIWRYQTNRAFETVSGGKGHGGAIESDGPVLTQGMILVNSGYLFGSRLPGNVLLAFSIDD